MFELEMTEELKDDFDEFWAIVPRKAGSKEKARHAWNKQTKANKYLIMKDIQKRYIDTEKAFIPYPTTYLNGKYWECEIESNVKMPQTNDEWQAEGNRLGIQPRSGETWPNYKDRISAAMRG